MVRGLLIVSVLLFAAVKCGRDGIIDTRGRSGKDAKPCTVTSVAGGALISCPDGSESFIANGSDGAAGADGVDGSDG